MKTRVALTLVAFALATQVSADDKTRAEYELNGARARARAAEAELKALRDRQLENQEARDAANISIAAAQEARAQFAEARDRALVSFRMQQEMQQNLDIEDFLKHFQQVDYRDADYDKKIIELAAIYPLALGTTQVQAALALREKERRVFQESEKLIREFVSKGLLTAKDFDTSEWEKGGNRPEIFKSNGQLDYEKAAIIAARNAEQSTGKVAKAQDDKTKE